MRSKIFSPSKQWCRKNSALSFSIRFTTLLLGIVGYQKIVCDCFGDASNNNRVTLWVHAFAPLSSTFQQKHAHCRVAFEAFSPPLYASDNYISDESEGATTKVIYSVFSKPAKTIFQNLLVAASSEDLLRLEDIYSSTNVDKESTWDELIDIINDGDMSVQELRALYNSALEGEADGLDLEGFKRLYQSIDELFDDDDEDEDNDNDEEKGNDSTEGEIDGPKPDSTEVEECEQSKSKQELLSFIEELQSRELDSDDGTISVGERRPWGLDFSDKERMKANDLIKDVLSQNGSSNLLANGKNGLPMSAKELVKYILGTWELTYTSSRTMIINRSLSGLGRSTSDLAKNLGLKMTLSGSYYFGQAEFVETFGSGNASASNDDENEPITLEAIVAGEWQLETGTRLDYKTGLPSISLRIEVETVAYGPTKGNAEQWDSLSPIKLVDMLYLDENLLIMRGNTNIDALFVYTR